MHSDWEEMCDDDEGGSVRRAMFYEPWWYKQTTHQSCDCGAPTETLDSHTGYSDSYFFRVRCTNCKHVWTGWMEG